MDRTCLKTANGYNAVAVKDMSAQPAPERDHTTITEWLTRFREDDGLAGARAVELLYPELHRMAQRHMRGERTGHTMAPTDLLNEAYLELVDKPQQSWQNRVHFLSAAAQAMRRILFDYARARATHKRGGASVRVDLRDDIASIIEHPEQYLAVEQALERLAMRDSELARIVEMRCFGGLSLEEIAAALGTSTRTIARRWKTAKDWLGVNLKV